MSKEIDISVILPVYNSEKFVFDAMSSVLRQGIDNIELLIVNDGSTDDSERVIDQFVKEHSFAKKINQENMGVAAARNHALDQAQGKYLAFLDSDDEFCDGALKAMFDTAEEKGADLVIGASVKVSDFNESIYKNSEMLSEKEFIEKDDPSLAYNFSVCNKLFKREKVEENSLRFRKLKHAEDGVFLFSFIEKAEMICGCGHPVYRYYHRMSLKNVSAVKSVDSSKFRDVTSALNFIYDISKDWSCEFRTALDVRTLRVTLINEYYRMLWNLDDDLFDEVLFMINRLKNKLPKEEWEEMQKGMSDLEIYKGICTKQEIASAPLVSIIIPEGMNESSINTMLSSLYYQQCPNFEVCCDASYKDKIYDHYSRQLNFHYYDIDLNDFRTALAYTKGSIIQVIDVPCVFSEDYLRLALRRIAGSNFDFISADIYYFSDEKILPVQKFNDIFTESADKEQRINDSSKRAFAATDKYSTNKLFKRDSLAGLLPGTKLSFYELVSTAYSELTYKRWNKYQMLFSDEPLYEPVGTAGASVPRITLICAGCDEACLGMIKDAIAGSNRFSVKTADIDRLLYGDIDYSKQLFSEIDSEWMMFITGNSKWKESSFDEISSFIKNRTEDIASCITMKTGAPDDDDLAFVFKRGTRTANFIAEPRLMINSVLNAVFKTEKFIETYDVVCEKGSVDVFELLSLYFMRNPKTGLVSTACVDVEDGNDFVSYSQPFDSCRRIIDFSYMTYDKLINYAKYVILYIMKKRDGFSEEEELMLLKQCGEKNIKKSKYHSKSEKKKMVALINKSPDEPDEESEDEGQDSKEKDNRYRHYAENLLTAFVFMILNRFFGIFTRVRPNKVMFISDVREKLGGNFESVYNYLDDEKYSKILYLKPDRRIRTPFKEWIRFVYDMSTAGTVLLEDYFRYTSYFRVRKRQQICQLWHAAGAFKKFGFSRAGGNEGIKIHKGYRKYTKAITSSKQIITNYADAFGISEDKIKATGTPRTDVFFDEEYKTSVMERLRKKYSLPENKKVILFAPTYRGLRAEEAGYDLSVFEPDLLYNSLHNDYVFVIKWHPAMYNNILLDKAFTLDSEMYSDFFIDVSDEKDIEDLMIVSDVLVTDYSSVIFDYYLLDRPLVFFAYDINEYSDGRGWYYPIEEYMYGPLARTQKELIYAIRNSAYDEEKRNVFGKKFMDACDGHSTEKTCDWIFGDMKA